MTFPTEDVSVPELARLLESAQGNLKHPDFLLTWAIPCVFEVCPPKASKLLATLHLIKQHGIDVDEGSRLW